MYKQEVSKIKKHIQKGRWWLDEVVNADDLDKVKSKLRFANYEMEAASVGVAELCRKADRESAKIELGEDFRDSASGTIELIEGKLGAATAWLYMKLDMLLPNTRNNVGIKTVSNTIDNLLDVFANHHGALPQYEDVFVVIIEHCKPDRKSCYDHDNKGFKAVPNALKGLIFSDDNQFVMSLGMFTRYSEVDFYTEVYVLPMSDLSYFAMDYLNY